MEFIPVAEPFLGGNELLYLQECIQTNWISSTGKFLDLFEKKFAEFCSCDYATSCSNGTTALHLALKAINVEPKDEVIVPNLTFVATANAVTYCGAKPILVDAEINTWNIDLTLIKEKITKKTKAIIPVHLYGHPCDMDPIIDLAKKNGLYIIEDAAQAHGAEYKGKKVGSLGDIGCFSFFGNKIMTTGEGGMCVTNDKSLEERIVFLKNHGMSKEKRYWHPEVGFNYRLTNLQAAVGLAQLEIIDKILGKKENIAAMYDKCLKDVQGIVLPPKSTWAKTVCWLYSVLITDDFPINRDELMKKLKENQIGSRPFFISLSQLPPHYTNEKFKISERLSKEGLNLPSSINLTEDKIEYITNVIKESARL